MLKKVKIITGIILCISTIFTSCNSQGEINKQQTSVHPAYNSGEKSKLDLNSEIIFRDKSDNLWFLNKVKGVYRYDGRSFDLFTSKDGLGSYRIISVQEDSAGNLYFDTPEGVYKFDGEKYAVLTVTEIGEAENVWKFESGDLWFRIGWEKDGPFRFDGKNLYHLKFPKNKMEDEFYKEYPNASINPYAIYSIYQDSKHNIWFGTSNLGIYLFDGKEISWMYENHLLETPEGGNFGIRSIAEDQDGDFWICNTNYRYSILPKDKEYDYLKSINYQRKPGIENKENLYFYSMESDDNGNLLMFAKKNGLWINNGKELTRLFIKDGDQNISPTSMYKDNQGLLWFGTDGNEIFTYKANTFEKFSVNTRQNE